MYSVKKKEKIEEMYFVQKMSLTNISKELGISISYISRILRNNTNYKEEQERRKKENHTKRRILQKELIHKRRREIATQKAMENQIIKLLHEQATKELSRGRTLGNDTLRKWCSLYKYNNDKKRYEFDSKKTLKPRDFPLYIKI